MPKPNRSHPHRLAAGCGSIILVLMVLSGLLWWRHLTRDPLTDDAFFWETTQTPRTTQTFVNTRIGLDGDRLAHYTGFTFQYPLRWQLDATQHQPGQPNYVAVARCPDGNPALTQPCLLPIEQFAVGPFWGPPQIQGSEPQLQDLLRQYNAQMAQRIPAYRKLSAGKTKVGAYSGYEIRYVGQLDRYRVNGQALQIWGRDIFLPDGTGKGVRLMTLATSLSPEVKRPEDVGIAGELPIVLKSFKFTAPPTQTTPGFFF